MWWDDLAHVLASLGRSAGALYKVKGHEFHLLANGL